MRITNPAAETGAEVQREVGKERGEGGEVCGGRGDREPSPPAYSSFQNMRSAAKTNKPTLPIHRNDLSCIPHSQVDVTLNSSVGTSERDLKNPTSGIELSHLGVLQET